MIKIIVFFFILFIASQALGANLTLTWNDNSTNEEGFILERGGIVIQPNGTLKATNFIEITRPPKDTTTHIDSTVLEGQFYCYRIAAFVTVTNAVPPESKSGFSNIVCGMDMVIGLTLP